MDGRKKVADELMSPRGIYRYEERPIARRLVDLSGKVLGLVDNSKQNADLFLDRVLEILSRSYAWKDVLRIKKPSGSVPATFPPEFFQRCDLAINAFGD